METDILWTVLLLYPDYAANTFGHDTFVARVEAPDRVDAAIREARGEAAEANQMERGDDFHVLAAIRGHHDIFTED